MFERRECVNIRVHGKRDQHMFMTGTGLHNPVFSVCVVAMGQLYEKIYGFET